MTVIKQGAAQRTEENHRWQWGCERDPINGHTNGLRQPWVTEHTHRRSPQAGCGFWCSARSRCSWTGCWTSVSSSVRWELRRAPPQGQSEREELSVTAGAIDRACCGKGFLSLTSLSPWWRAQWAQCGSWEPSSGTDTSVEMKGLKNCSFRLFFLFFFLEILSFTSRRSGSVALGAAKMAIPDKFRVWCLQVSLAPLSILPCWLANEAAFKVPHAFLFSFLPSLPPPSPSPSLLFPSPSFPLCGLR